MAVFSYLYQLPGLKNANPLVKQALGGWQIAGINNFQSGSPLTITTGSDVALTGVGYDRPNLIGNPRLARDRSTNDKTARWFDTSVFQRNAVGAYGNAGRSIVTAPGSWSWDISFQKTFPILGERHRVEFRGDFFNVLNHANLSSPATTFSATQSFGRITSTGSARVTQFALRYEF